jgi:hypothetical protein
MNIILNSKQLVVFLKVSSFSQISVRNVMMSIPAMNSRAETTNILTQLATRRLVMVSTFADSMYQITAYGKKYLNTLPIEVRNQEITSRPPVKRVQTSPAEEQVINKTQAKAKKVVELNTDSEDIEMKNMFKANSAKDKAIDKVKAQTEQSSKVSVQQEADAKVKAQQEADDKVKAQQEADAKVKAQQEADAKVKAQQEADAKVKAQQEADAKVKAQQEADAKVKAQQEADAKVKAQQEADAKVKAQQEADAKVKAQQEADAKVKTQQEAEKPKPLTCAEIEHKERLKAIRAKSLKDKTKRDKHIAQGKLKSKISESISRLDKTLSKPEIVIENSELKSEALEMLAKEMPSELKLLLQDISTDINLASA